MYIIENIAYKRKSKRDTRHYYYALSIGGEIFFGIPGIKKTLSTSFAT